MKYCEVNENNELELHMHAGQLRAWDSKKRIVAILAGAQSGKTTFGKDWLRREIQLRGPGDYLIVSPSLKIQNRRLVKDFKRLFERTLQLGRYKAAPVPVFEFSEYGNRSMFPNWDGETPTTIYFGHAQDPDSLESMTAKAAWLDEAGQKKFRLGSWEAIRRRLSIARGRILITTTPYDLGWLKQKIYDPWKSGEDKNIDVINFRSIDNPAFSLEEYEEARRTLPFWKFNMFHNGLFERPAGLIYDSFKNELTDGVIHRVPRFTIPEHWKRYMGIDYGGVNTVAVFYAMDPDTGALYLYREYHAGKRTAAQHAGELLRGERGIPLAVGGAPSEGQWRREFRAGGLPVRKPIISDVEVGIDRVYGAHCDDKIYVFDDMSGYLDQKMSYSREVDENGEPTAKIADKASFHYMDAERYIISYLMRPGQDKKPKYESTPVAGPPRHKTMRGRL